MRQTSFAIWRWVLTDRGSRAVSLTQFWRLLVSCVWTLRFTVESVRDLTIFLHVSWGCDPFCWACAHLSGRTCRLANICTYLFLYFFFPRLFNFYYFVPVPCFLDSKDPSACFAPLRSSTGLEPHPGSTAAYHIERNALVQLEYNSSVEEP